MSDHTAPAAASWHGRVRSYHGLRLLQLDRPSRLLVTVAGAPGARASREIVRGVLAGGAGLVRLGCPGRTTREIVDETVQAVWACRGARALCLVRGRVDVALAVMADGVHLDPGDMPVALARRLLGPAATIGVTCHGLADAVEARREGASYVAVEDTFIGGPEHQRERLVLLHAIGERAGLPLCVGGGVGLDNVAMLGGTPAFLIAADTTLTRAPDPESVTRALLARMAGAMPAPAFAPAPLPRSPQFSP